MYNEYLFRSSQLGKLMTKSRAKGELSKTTQSYLHEALKIEHFGKYIPMITKYTEKGIRMEDDAIEMLSRVDGKEYGKNAKRYNNDWITGEPDVITDNKIIDIKCSWSYSTFPLLDDKIHNKDYFHQLQGYMWLLGKPKAELVYCLMDTPQDLAYTPVDQLKYSHIPENMRIKRFCIDYDPEVIESLKEKITACRDTLNSLQTMITKEQRI